MAKTFEQRVAERIANLKTVDAVKKLAGSIATRADNLDVDMHSAGVGALFCAMTFRDTSAVASVANSLGKHTRGKAFAEWVEAHSNVLMVLDKKTSLWAAKMVPAEYRKDDAALAQLITEATANPFWKPEEKSSRDFSLHAALAMLLKKAETAKGKGVLSDAEKLALIEIAAIADRAAAADAAPAEAPADALETVG